MFARQCLFSFASLACVGLRSRLFSLLSFFSSYLSSKMLSLRNRCLFFTSLCMLFIFATLYYRMPGLSRAVTENVHEIPLSPAEPLAQAPPVDTPKHTLIYKPQPTAKALPIVDNFPLAAAARSAKALPPVPSWNRPPARHVPESTPLFIGFTRNWRLLQQVVVSYITAGWPPEDVHSSFITI